MALPPGTDDAGWLRAFHAVVPAALRAFRPQVLFTQCGADTYRLDPLADLRLSVDGQRATYIALRALADELCDGALGRHGRRRLRAVRGVCRGRGPTCSPPRPAQPLAPETLDHRRPGGSWPSSGSSRRARAAARGCGCTPDGPGIPVRMTDGVDPTFEPWHPGDDATPLDRAITATLAAR